MTVSPAPVTPLELVEEVRALRIAHRRMRATLIAVAAGAAALASVAWSAQEPAGTLQVRRLEIVEADGRVRATLLADPATHGAARLQFVDRAGRAVVNLGESGDGGGALHFHGNEGKVAASLTSSFGGNSLLEFRDREGVPRIHLGVMAWKSPEGRPPESWDEPDLTFRDGKGETRIRAGVGKEGGGSLWVKDAASAISPRPPR